MTDSKDFRTIVTHKADSKGEGQSAFKNAIPTVRSDGFLVLKRGKNTIAMFALHTWDWFEVVEG